MLGSGICAGGEVLLDLEDAGEEVGVEGMGHDFLGEGGVNLEGLLLGLVARELGDEVAELGSGFGDMAAFVVGFEAARDFVEEGPDGGEVGVAELVVELVGGVELDAALHALLGRRRGGSSKGCLLGILAWGRADDGGVDFGLVVFDAKEFVDEPFVGELGEKRRSKVDFPIYYDEALDRCTRHHA